MGYSFTKAGGLCCDDCSEPGNGVTKHRCPFGYCPQPALCVDCRAKDPSRLKGWHVERGCGKASEDFHRRQALTKELLAEGKAVRRAAYGLDRVHVLFEYADGKTIGFYMDPATYAGIPLVVPATPEDYALFGTLTAAPATFQTGRTTKEVVA